MALCKHVQSPSLMTPHTLVTLTALLLAAVAPAVLVHASTDASAAVAVSDGTAYTAAVVQWRGVENVTAAASAQIAANIDGFEPYVRDAAAAGAQIIVFPEGALGMFNAVSRKSMAPYCVRVGKVGGSNPCAEARAAITAPSPSDVKYQLFRASCMALKYNITLLLDVCESLPCASNSPGSACPADGHFQYNSALAFDQSGTLAVHYRKAHLFGESSMLDQAQAAMTALNSSFGVRFGVFVCNDIQYAHPARDDVAPVSAGGLGVHDVLYPTHWVNAPPTFNAIMVQQGYSRVTRTNLLAANGAIGASIDSGSGIFASGEPLATAFYPNSDAAARTRMLIANLTSPSPAAVLVKEVESASTVSAVARHSEPAYPTVVVSDSDLPTNNSCFINFVLSSGVPCKVFTLWGLAALAGPDVWSNNQAVRFVLPPLQVTYLGQNTSVLCHASVTFFTTHAASLYEQWAFVGLDEPFYVPDTPDELRYQGCALQHCSGGASGCDVGVATFETYQTRVAAVEVRAQGINATSSTPVLPMLAVEDGQVTGVDKIDFVDATPNSKQHKTSHVHRRNHHAQASMISEHADRDVSALRSYRVTSTDTFKNESLYSVGVFAFLPYRASFGKR